MDSGHCHKTLLFWDNQVFFILVKPLKIKPQLIVCALNLKDFSQKIHTTTQPVFVSHKIE